MINNPTFLEKRERESVSNNPLSPPKLYSKSILQFFLKFPALSLIILFYTVYEREYNNIPPIT